MPRDTNFDASALLPQWFSREAKLGAMLPYVSLVDQHTVRTRGNELFVTSRKVVWLFPEQLWFEFVPILHRLQGRLAAQG